jgi:hypothetical protein
MNTTLLNTTRATGALLHRLELSNAAAEDKNTPQLRKSLSDIEFDLKSEIESLNASAVEILNQGEWSSEELLKNILNIRVQLMNIYADISELTDITAEVINSRF